MLSLDTETTGVDFQHGARPYFVTLCDEQSVNTYFEWDVDPLTRKVKIPRGEIEELIDIIEDADSLILQNSKFDVRALSTVFPKSFKWPWKKTHDTLIAGHLLCSNTPHDLTSMVIQYLGVDVSKYEDRMEAAVKKVINLVRRKNSPIGDWRIARKGLPEMPSAKETTWKYDTWLLRAVEKYELFEYFTDPEEAKNWFKLTVEYANSDSLVTFNLYRVMETLLKEKNLWEIYVDRLKILYPVYKAEQRGITYSRKRLVKLEKEYEKVETECRNKCLNIAKSKDYELTLPKTGNNNSLREFVFDHLKLPVVSKSKKTGQPSLDKNVLEEYATTLPARSKQLTFVNSLSSVRSRATARNYMEGYERFSIKSDEDWGILFPSLNITGTHTLRFSSNNPNEQNISKKEGFNLRYAFGPLPGREWWSLDANNIELRIPAYESKEQELIDLFENSHEPPYYGSNHLLNFHTVYPDIWNKELKAVGIEKVGPHCKNKYKATWYQYCKNGGFAVQYGAIELLDGKGTADKAFHKPGAHALLKKRFSKLEKLNNQCISQARQRGYVCTLPDRTVNPEQGYPLYCKRDQYGSIKPTIPLNYHVQGTACWVLARAMVKIQRYLDQLNRRAGKEDYFLIMQIHDEVVLDFPFVENQGNLPIVRTIQTLMSSLGNDLVPRIPLPVGIEYHPNNWGESEDPNDE